MRTATTSFVTAGLVLAAGAGGYWIGYRNAGGSFPVADRQPFPADYVPTTAMQGNPTGENGLSGESPETIAALFERALRDGFWKQTKQWELRINRFTPSDIANLMVIWERHPDSRVRLPLMRMLYMRWAEMAPLAALEHARQQPNKSDRKQAEAFVLSGWAYADAAGLHAWATPPPPRRNSNLKPWPSLPIFFRRMIRPPRFVWCKP